MAELTFKFFTVKHYAAEVNKHPRTVRRWIGEKKLRAKKDLGGRGWLIIVRNVADFVKN